MLHHTTETGRALRHLGLPAIVPLAFSVVTATPVEAIGCRNRGLLALLIALGGALGSLGAAIVALRGRMHGERSSAWWLASALVLMIPAVVVLVLVK